MMPYYLVEDTNVEKTKSFKLLDWFSVLFVVMLLISNIVASKLVLIAGILIPAAVFLFPLTYIFGDVLTEVYGYERNRKIIWQGFFANIIMSLSFVFIIALPYPEFWNGQGAFKIVLGVVPRIVIASLAGFWAGSFTNSYVMAKMKVWMRTFDKADRLLFLRTIGSTIVGEGVDTLIFISIAFIGTMPASVVVRLIVVQYICKVIIEILMTPITYWIVKKAKQVEGVDAIGAESYNPVIMS
jgi:uncharacterized integral membrane protein (TIGR00697 family)